MKRLARVRSTTRNIHGRNGESGGTFLEATAEVTEVTMCGIPTLKLLCVLCQEEKGWVGEWEG
jgi:hypothetical protein